MFACSFENNYTHSHISSNRLDQYKNKVNVNDYAVSNIREYLTGVNVYRGCSERSYDRKPALATGQEKEENFLDVFNITNSLVYNLIEGRSLSDLYSRMSGSTSVTAVEFDTDVRNGVTGVAGINPDTTKDKLWLLSSYEASKITRTQSSAADSGARSWNAKYWLRSPHPSYTTDESYIDASGQGFITNAFYTRCARPAFKISF